MSSHGEAEAGAPFQQLTLADRATEARVSSIVFDDIVPRLKLLHHDVPPKGAERAFTRQEIVAFGQVLIASDSADADEFLHKMRIREASEDVLVLGLLTQAARYLGAQWEADRCSFVDVTIGVARLQKMLCVFAGKSDAAFSDRRQRAALCTLAGERHDFGLEMVACFMRQARWDVDVQKNAETDEVVDLVGRGWFAVLGFTASSELGLDALCRAIKSGRAASLNPEIGVLVGGPLFNMRPGLVAQVGADAMAGDAASATVLARKLLLRQDKTRATSRLMAGFAPADSHAFKEMLQPESAHESLG